MSKIGLTADQIEHAERRRDSAMIELLLNNVDEEKFDTGQVLTLNRFLGKLVLGRSLCLTKRAWVEQLIVRHGLSGDVGLVEDYAERSYAGVARGIDAEWRMGPKVLAPPPSRRRP